MTDNYSMVTNTTVAGTSNYLPVPIADNQEAGATPNPDPKLHVDPIVAGGKIRKLAREIAHKLETSGGNYNHSSLWQNATYGIKQMRAHLESAALVDQKIDEQIQELHLVIGTRKAGEGRLHLKHLVRTLDLERHKRQSASMYCTHSWEHDNIGVFKPGTNTDTALKMVEELIRLTQSLPTITNAPLTHPENTLRAIASILKNNGYFEKAAKFNMHPTPTSEQKPYNDDYDDDEVEQPEYEDPDEEEV